MAGYDKKRVLTGILQYIGAAVLLCCTLLFIWGFQAGKLPFMDGDYLDARRKAEKEDAAELDTGTDDAVSHQPAQETAETFIARLERAGRNSVPYAGVYGDGCTVAVRSLSGVDLSDGAVPDLCEGFLIVKKNGAVVAVYDGLLNDISGIVDGCGLTFCRDAEGRPLFYRDGYYYFENGALVPAEYDANNLDKGLSCEYPYYLAPYDERYAVFEGEGGFGLRRTGDGGVVVPAEYAAVYGMCEGVAVAVDKDGRLYLYGEDGALISGEYLGPETNDVTATGYFFVRNGLTRARRPSGEEVVLRADGRELLLPSGFKVLAYSDGAVMLSGADGCGFLGADGRWISPPDYAEVRPFKEGLAVVRNGEGLYGMIDLDGNAVIPCLFDSISDCSDGVILAYTQKLGYCLFNKLSA